MAMFNLEITMFILEMPFCIIKIAEVGLEIVLADLEIVNLTSPPAPLLKGEGRSVAEG